jgi:hypothetical protein
MTFGLVAAIGIMIVEMILFIRRATQMEGAFEKKVRVKVRELYEPVKKTWKKVFLIITSTLTLTLTATLTLTLTLILKPSALQEANAQMRSGALMTSLSQSNLNEDKDPNHNPNNDPFMAEIEETGQSLGKKKTN